MMDGSASCLLGRSPRPTEPVLSVCHVASSRCRPKWEPRLGAGNSGSTAGIPIALWTQKTDKDTTVYIIRYEDSPSGELCTEKS